MCVCVCDQNYKFMYHKWNPNNFGPALDDIQSTLVISKFMGLSEILRDIRTPTYQIYRTEEKINRTNAFHK